MTIPSQSPVDGYSKVLDTFNLLQLLFIDGVVADNFVLHSVDNSDIFCTSQG